MSATRLAFLYPSFPSLRIAEPLASRLSRPPSRCARPAATARDGPRLGRRIHSTRHGTAVEPIPLVDSDSGVLPTKPDGPASEPTKAESKVEEAKAGAKDEAADKLEEEDARSTKASSTESGAPSVDEAKVGEAKAAPEQDQPPPSRSPMEKVLHMSPPEAMVAKGAEASHPPPRYVHHFDSYETVNRLAAAGFTREQGVTVMKALRGILSEKVTAAQEELVSRGDVDNESYLFKAACSELSTEVKNNTRAADEVTREQRMRLQHEVDILSQSMSQKLVTLNDTIRGTFNDRKMAVREQQKAIENSIQQTNYKIGTTISSDAKTEIEGLRWILIRRSAIALAFMAMMVLATLRYSLYVKEQRKMEEDRARKRAEERKLLNGTEDRSSAPDAVRILAAS